MTIGLRLTGRQHQVLRQHLFPGDGLEAVAIALCGRRRGSRGVSDLSVHRIACVPHRDSTRRRDRVTWPTAAVGALIEEAMRRDMAIAKFHSHPDGLRAFSSLDDASDRRFFDSVFGWTDSPDPHAALVMLPDGELFGRAILDSGGSVPLERVGVIGDDLSFWYGQRAPLTGADTDSFSLRTRQAFGAGTVARLARISAAVVGCSGTGSIVAEFLVRLGVGRLVLVDHDAVEEKNLNRIVNATGADADGRRPKAEVLCLALSNIGLATRIEPLVANLVSRAAVEAVSSCDVAFGCMDSAEGRHVLNRLAACYLLPYFDMGVRLEADGQGGVSQVCAAVNYVQPDGPSLLSRGVYTLARVEAEALRRVSPDQYEQQLKEGYIRGVPEDRPAVISVNGLAASLAVNEFLARLHPYRVDPNGGFARVTMSLSHGLLMAEPEGMPDATFGALLGRGDLEPLLQMPELS